MLCAKGMMIEVAKLKAMDEFIAETKRLENLGILCKKLSDNKPAFFEKIEKAFLDNRATEISLFLTDAHWGDTYGFEGTLVSIAEKSFYANGRWNGYKRPWTDNCVVLEDVIVELQSLCFNVKVSMEDSQNYYIHSRKEEKETCKLIKFTVSVDPMC